MPRVVVRPAALLPQRVGCPWHRARTPALPALRRARGCGATRGGGPGSEPPEPDELGSSSSEDRGRAEDTPAARLTQNLANLVANPASYLGAFVIVAAATSRFNFGGGAVVALSALPVVALTAISKSSAGQEVRRAVEQEKPRLLAEADRAEAQRVVARSGGDLSRFYGDTRSVLQDPPSHLQGQLAGDAGFDPLGLAASPSEDASAEVDAGDGWRDGALKDTRLGRLYQAELLHARWAMLGAVGCLVPELLQRQFGVAIAEPIWWKVGGSVLNEGIAINYAGLEGLRIAGDKGVLAIAACQLALMGGPEYARQVGIASLEPVGIFLPGDVNYPGGPLFDPLGLAKDPDTFLTQAVAEIKHGRLAMLAMAGYAAQAAVTQEGPIANLEATLARIVAHYG